MSQFKEIMDVASDGVIWKVCNENNIEVGGASVNAETRELTVTEPGTYHIIVSNADQTKNYIHKEVEKTNDQGEKYREWVAIETVASDTLTVIAKQFAEINQFIASIHKFLHRQGESLPQTALLLPVLPYQFPQNHPQAFLPRSPLLQSLLLQSLLPRSLLPQSLLPL